MSQRTQLSREEIAKIGIGHTDSTPAINRFLTSFFLAVITAVPLVQLVHEFASIRTGQEPDRTLPQSLDVFSLLLPRRAELAELGRGEGGFLAAGGRMNNRMLRDIQRYETDLKDRDGLMQWVIPRMQVPVTAWLRGGNGDAVRSTSARASTSSITRHPRSVRPGRPGPGRRRRSPGTTAAGRSRTGSGSFPGGTARRRPAACDGGSP